MLTVCSKVLQPTSTRLLNNAFWMQVVAGQTAALALKKIKRTAVRKGMVLVDEKLRPHACWEFNAEIAILTHSTTIQPRYQVGHAPVDTGCGMVCALLGCRHLPEQL
jgi:GTPase